MAQFGSTDRDYLLTRQYQDGSNLSVRMNLHERFSTNPYGWHRWVFDILALRPEQRVLELGSGTGALWLANQNRLPANSAITLSDLSGGMLEEARQRLGSLADRFVWADIDAQSIPYSDASFDVVIANHMLYHVPDRNAALREIRRVLASDGTLFAATNGEAHMRELDDLLINAVPKAQSDGTAPNFSLENGTEQLRRHFANVRLHEYPDGLEITDPDPAVGYLVSTTASNLLDGTYLLHIREAIQGEIERHGAFRITKSTGLFECSGVLD